VPEAVSELAFALGGGRDDTEAAAPIQVGASAEFGHAEAV
jgi:hypothetical protein